MRQLTRWVTCLCLHAVCLLAEPCISCFLLAGQCCFHLQHTQPGGPQSSWSLAACRKQLTHRLYSVTMTIGQQCNAVRYNTHVRVQFWQYLLCDTHTFVAMPNCRAHEVCASKIMVSPGAECRCICLNSFQGRSLPSTLHAHNVQTQISSEVVPSFHITLSGIKPYIAAPSIPDIPTLTVQFSLVV